MTFRSSGRLFVNTAYACGGYHARDIMRPAAYGLVAIGATDATNHSALVDIGFTVDLMAAKLSPIFNYRYSRTTFDAYAESGAAGGGIAVSEFTADSNVASVGAEVTFPWSGF